MSRIKSKNTKPEIRLRKKLWGEGLRYRLHYKIQNIRPDIVFLGSKLCIFVDGCQWHGCPDHYVLPRTNVDFWQAKLIENVKRDTKQTELLGSKGWKVYRVWEHEIWEDLCKVIRDIRTILDEQDIELEDWRVFRVEVIDANIDLERRFMQSLQHPNKKRVIERIRSTRKWGKS